MVSRRSYLSSVAAAVALAGCSGQSTGSTGNAITGAEPSERGYSISLADGSAVDSLSVIGPDGSAVDSHSVTSGATSVQLPWIKPTYDGIDIPSSGTYEVVAVGAEGEELGSVDLRYNPELELTEAKAGVNAKDEIENVSPETSLVCTFENNGEGPAFFDGMSLEANGASTQVTSQREGTKTVSILGNGNAYDLEFLIAARGEEWVAKSMTIPEGSRKSYVWRPFKTDAEPRYDELDWTTDSCDLSGSLTGILNVRHGPTRRYEIDVELGGATKKNRALLYCGQPSVVSFSEVASD